MSRAFLTNARVSTVAAVATVLSLAIAGQAWQRLGATEASEVGGSTPSVAFIGQVQQDLLPVDQLLESVAGLNPVACRLASQTLENRWGRGAVSPNWGLPGDGGTEVSEVVRSAMRGDVSADDVETLTTALGSNDNCQRQVAAQLLGRVDGSQVANRLVRTLETGSSPRLRIGAAMALGYGEWSEGLPALESSLGSLDADLRRTHGVGAGPHGEPGCRRPVVAGAPGSVRRGTGQRRRRARMDRVEFCGRAAHGGAGRCRGGRACERCMGVRTDRTTGGHSRADGCARLRYEPTGTTRRGMGVGADRVRGTVSRRSCGGGAWPRAAHPLHVVSALPQSRERSDLGSTR